MDMKIAIVALHTILSLQLLSRFQPMRSELTCVLFITALMFLLI